MNIDLSNMLTLEVKGERYATVTNYASYYPSDDWYDSAYRAVYNGFNFYKQVIMPALYVYGTKTRLVDTKNYSNRLQYCYETPTPMFGDIGSGELDNTGVCYVEIDDIFSETVRTDIEYYVFLQKEGKGDLWVDSKDPVCFTVKGTPNLKFSWEIKAVQNKYEDRRLDEFGTDIDIEDENEIESIYENEINEYEEEMEGIYNE